ncbi:hypothetical protein ACFL1N_08110 [Thermodesulfobacteriota bacterium]
MKKLALLMGILLIAGCATTSGPPGPSIDGKWEGTLDMMGQSMKLAYDFKSEGAMLTGIAYGPQGDPLDITNGKIDGNNISFDVEVTGQMSMTVKYTGVLMGDELALTMEMDMGEGGPPGGGPGGPPGGGGGPGGGGMPPNKFIAKRVMGGE